MTLEEYTDMGVEWAYNRALAKMIGGVARLGEGVKRCL